MFNLITFKKKKIENQGSNGLQIGLEKIPQTLSIKITCVLRALQAHPLGKLGGCLRPQKQVYLEKKKPNYNLKRFFFSSGIKP
jgi:hypothetical protein